MTPSERLKKLTAALEFDSAAQWAAFQEFLEEYAKTSAYHERRNSDTFHLAGAEHVHARLCPIHSALKAVVEAMASLNRQFDWYANTFAGWEDCPHEFEHWWRVEAPAQIEQALAALDSELAKLEGK